jgi:hypothetical protein
MRPITILLSDGDSLQITFTAEQPPGLLASSWIVGFCATSGAPLRADITGRLEPVVPHRLEEPPSRAEMAALRAAVIAVLGTDYDADGEACRAISHAAMVARMAAADAARIRATAHLHDPVEDHRVAKWDK